MRNIWSLSLCFALITAACGAAVDPALDDGNPTSITFTNAPSPATGPTTTTTGTAPPGETATTIPEDGSETPESDQPPDLPVEHSNDAPAREDRLDSEPAKAPQPAPTSAVTPTVGEVPAAIMDDILAHAESLAGAPRADFTTLRAERVIWNDGSLGCPEPGLSYTQASVPGYWVVLGHGATQYDYRATELGMFRLCANPSSSGTVPNR